jgi:uncharacterized protein YkwD
MKKFLYFSIFSFVSLTAACAPKSEFSLSNVQVECEASAKICQLESLMVEYTNQVRAKYGKPPVRANQMVAFGARNWSERQARLGRISHDGFPQVRQSTIKRKYGADVALFAENVASNYSSVPKSAEEIAEQFVFDQWEQSQGHLKNMLGNFREIGIGVAVKNGQYYATQIFR